ncbi:MAG: hypothetical protein OXF52_02660 [Candidatus Dadabacteria bacterium]|nr:hypothetical protein [Candidatus Dadabacteria bacterium]
MNKLEEQGEDDLLYYQCERCGYMEMWIGGKATLCDTCQWEIAEEKEHQAEEKERQKCWAALLVFGFLFFVILLL